jgi:NhaA family Na+:H+ antiporter
MAAAGGTTRWWERDSTPGYVLLSAAIASFVLLNGPTSEGFKALLRAPIELTVGGYHVEYYLSKFIKDALMCVFFLYVGLELKRECIEGPFRNPREAALPALGAIGGMAAPALVYLLIATQVHPDADSAYVRGWAIPTATDIAFAVGVLSLLGARLTAGMRLFLLALAIADDLGAILVIAVFYSDTPNMVALAAAGAIFGVQIILNRRGVTALTPYWVLGVLLWAAMAKSGVSPTLAGVLTALAIPMRDRAGRSPLVAAEHALKPYVQLGVMPIFAIASAGVPLAGVTLETFTHPVTLGIALGLLIGKPLGIVTLTVVGAAVLRQRLPCTIPSLIGLALVAGIGFTMSLFVGALAFYGDAALEAPIRFGVLGGSFLAAGLGLLILTLTLQRKAAPAGTSALAREEELAEDRGVLEDFDPPSPKS